MSEEQPRLSRREMREQGLLKAVSVDDEGPSPVELLSQTSELHLRRPSRKELRLQREANEAKEAEQAARFAGVVPARQDEAEKKAAEEKARAEKEAAEKKAAEEKARAEKEAAEKKAAEEKARAEKEAADAKKGDGATPGEEPRKSVFERFHKKADDREEHEGSLQDRFLARTKGDRSEERPLVPAKEFDFPAQIDEETDLTPFADVSEEDLALLAQAEAEEDAARAQEEAAHATAQLSTAEKKEITADTQSVPVADTAVREAVQESRYPTDVSLRFDDEDEDDDEHSRLTFWLIVLIGLLIGLAVGLVAQKLIYGSLGAGELENWASAAAVWLALGI